VGPNAKNARKMAKGLAHGFHERDSRKAREGTEQRKEKAGCRRKGRGETGSGEGFEFFQTVSGLPQLGEQAALVFDSAGNAERIMVRSGVLALKVLEIDLFADNPAIDLDFIGCHSIQRFSRSETPGQSGVH
jgi:hypothetical protein